jgi:hypothetical protein
MEITTDVHNDIFLKPQSWQSLIQLRFLVIKLCTSFCLKPGTNIKDSRESKSPFLSRVSIICCALAAPTLLSDCRSSRPPSFNILRTALYLGLVRSYTCEFGERDTYNFNYQVESLGFLRAFRLGLFSCCCDLRALVSGTCDLTSLFVSR